MPPERSPPCLVYTTVIRRNQHAFQCDKCDRWQYRACNTGFSRQQYLDIVNVDYELPSWYCSPCSAPDTSEDITSGIKQSTISSVPHLNTESSPISVIPVGDLSKHDVDMDLEPESIAHTDMNAQVRQAEICLKEPLSTYDSVTQKHSFFLIIHAAIMCN